MKIYLVGFMGAGKTTIGRLLAARLGWPFFDLDDLIETAEGKPVKAIFAENGEPYFRRREREILQTTRLIEQAVIATGGGTFTFDENVSLIRSAGCSIFLSIPFAVIAKRVSEKAEDRPLFRDEAQARELYQQRTRFYRAADFTIDMGERDTPAEIVERLFIDLPREVFDGRSTRVGP